MMKNSTIGMSRVSANTGYSIIEVMLTLVVVGVGILAIVQLQSGLSGQVGDNKAKAEATALAEGRIEYLRNYIDETEFGAKLLATSPLGSYRDVPTKTEDPVNGFYDPEGVNATFTMEELIDDGDEIKEVSVKVSWQDRTGSSREITVTSEINFVPPVAYGQKALNYKLPVDFNLPSGAALPGEGTLSDLGLTGDPNDDGTSEVVEGKNRYLAVGDDIVLILPQKDTCDSGGSDCNEFTRIHGRVYISTRKNNRPTIHEVNVIASNTAYCTRYYLDNGTVIPVGTNTAAAAPLTKDNGSYEYFDYTCYVGPGWYGNIGIYKAGGNKQDDKVCMGEPYSTNPSLSIAQSYFRTYRGILYRLGSTNSYWSIGVKGGLDLGLDAGEPKHNFVFGTFAPELNDDQDCINSGLVVREDAVQNNLFDNVPTDFVCLNPDVYSYDDTVFGLVSSCTAGEVYDPTL